MFGTKVSINKVGRGGKITINFYSASDVHRILDKIGDKVSANSSGISEKVFIQNSLLIWINTF